MIVDIDNRNDKKSIKKRVLVMTTEKKKNIGGNSAC